MDTGPIPRTGRTGSCRGGALSNNFVGHLDFRVRSTRTATLQVLGMAWPGRATFLHVLAENAERLPGVYQAGASDLFPYGDRPADFCQLPAWLRREGGAEQAAGGRMHWVHGQRLSSVLTRAQSGAAGPGGAANVLRLGVGVDAVPAAGALVGDCRVGVGSRCRWPWGLPEWSWSCAGPLRAVPGLRGSVCRAAAGPRCGQGAPGTGRRVPCVSGWVGLCRSRRCCGWPVGVCRQGEAVACLCARGAARFRPQAGWCGRGWGVLGWAFCDRFAVACTAAGCA